MAWTQTTLTNAADCLTKFKAFVAGKAGAITGTRTGTGSMVGLDIKTAVITETWTITCVTAVTNGGIFSVVGSVSGAQSNATVGTAYSNSKIKFTILDGATDYLVGDTFIFSTTIGGLGSQAWETIADTAAGSGSQYDYVTMLQSSFTGTGNGTLNTFRVLDGISGTETWTLTCTAAATNAGTFSVVGSVSGAQAAATVGAPYNNGRISFTLVDGGADFAVSDAFTVTHTGITAGGEQRVLVFRSKGLTGADTNLYHTYTQEFYPAVDRWFVGVRNHSAYSNLAATYAQANITPSTRRIRLVNSSMPAVFIADGRCAKMLVESASTARQCNYSGFFIPHADPSLSEYPFPCFTGGSCSVTASGTPDTYAGTDYAAFFVADNYSASSSAIFFPTTNAWSDVSVFSNGARVSAQSGVLRILPWCCDDASIIHGASFKSSGAVDRITTIPSLIVSTKTECLGVLGEFSGVSFVSGHAVAAWDKITIGSTDWLVWNSPKQEANYCYAAFELSGSQFT